jgi:metal-sulfur cluster biosynthetic enzyme
MSDEKNPEGVNPHTGQPWPADPANPSAVGAPPSDGIPPAAKPSGPPQFSSMPSQQELAVRAALETVMDPEIQLSVIDLGLIREIHLLPEKTLVRMMLTTPFCPYAPQMIADVKQATESAVPRPCEVDMLPDPWSPEMMPDPGLLGFSF